jgi:hypothetical protein
VSIEAPTDAQLSYIASLCNGGGWQHPEVVVSKEEASEIIDALKNSTYDPRRYDYPFEAA